VAFFLANIHSDREPFVAVVFDIFGFPNRTETFCPVPKLTSVSAALAPALLGDVKDVLRSCFKLSKSMTCLIGESWRLKLLSYRALVSLRPQLIKNMQDNTEDSQGR
jgi:hypothetical protein